MPTPLTGGHIGLFYQWAFQQTGWNTGMDANLRLLEVIVGLNVKSRTTTAPPGSPADWDTYLVPSGASGAWTANVGKFTYWLNSTWNYITPKEGMLFSCEDSADDGKALKWESSAVVTIAGGGAGTLAALTDVDLSGLLDGDMLVWDAMAGNWVPQPQPTGLPPSGSASGDLSGSYPGPTVSKVNGRPFSISNAPLVGFVIRWDGTNWGDAALAFTDLGDVTVTSPAAGETVLYNGTVFANRLPIDPIASFVNGKPSASLVIFRFVAARAFTLPTNLSGSYFKAGVAATASTAFDIQKNGVSIGTLTFAASGTSATFSVTSTSFAAGDVLTVIAPATQDTTLADLAITLLPS